QRHHVPGYFKPRLEQALLARGGPAPRGDRLPGQIDDSLRRQVDKVAGPATHLGAAGQQALHPARVTRGNQDAMPILMQAPTQSLSDETTAASDQDSHAIPRISPRLYNSCTPLLV